MSNELPQAWLIISATNNKVTEMVKRFIYTRFPEWDSDRKAFLILLASMIVGIAVTLFTEGAFDIFRGTFLADNPLVASVVIGITSAFGADAMRFVLSLKDVVAPKQTVTLEAESLSVKSEPVTQSENG